MDTNRIRIGQIGTKHAHATGKFQTMRELNQLYEVAGIVEADEKRQNEMAAHPAYEEANWLTEDQLLSTECLKVVAVETA